MRDAWQLLGEHYLGICLVALGLVLMAVIGQLARHLFDRFPTILGKRSTGVLVALLALLIAGAAVSARLLDSQWPEKEATSVVETPDHRSIVATGRSEVGWGPDRITYTMASPATEPVLNSITDSPYGDERNFVRVKNVRHGSFIDEDEACSGDIVEAAVYVSNDVSSHLGDEGTIRGLTVRMMATSVQEQTVVTAVLDATNADSVWDSASISCAGRPVQLRLLEGASRMTTIDQPDGYLVRGNPFDAPVPIGKASQDGLFSEGAHVDGHAGWAAFLMLQFEVL